MSIRFFNPGLTYKKYEKEIDEATKRVLSKGDLILRQDVAEFEERLKEFTGAKYAVALNSGTDGLYLALKALNIGPGDEVLVPSRTFVATAQVVQQVGADLRQYDIGEIPEIHANTQAIIPVHIEGYVDPLFADLYNLAKDHGIAIIEDACQALGAEFAGKKAGTLGDVGVFSHYPAKILGAFGDAGSIVTDNERIYRYIKDARNHFKDDARDWGINSRMDNLQAAYLNIRIKDLPEMLSRRQEIAEMYTKSLKGCSVPKNFSGRVWQDYIIRTDKRDELYEYLKQNGVETMKNNYPFPILKLPLAQAYENETLRLPCNENLTNDEVEEVIRLVNKFYE